MTECSIKSEGYIPYYSNNIPMDTDTDIVIRKNVDGMFNGLTKEQRFRSSILNSDRGYKYNVVTYDKSFQTYTLSVKNNNDINPLNINQVDITISPTDLKKYSLYLTQETIDKIENNNNKKADHENSGYQSPNDNNGLQAMERIVGRGGGGYRKSRKQNSKKRRTVRKPKSLRKKTRRHIRKSRR